MGLRVAEQWAATEVAKTIITDQAVANRVAAEQAAGSTGWASLLAHWLGLEAAKTSTTTAHAAVRASADSGGSFVSAIGSMVASWLGLETTKTGATVAQEAIRGGVQEAASATQLATTLSANVAAGMSYAAVGATAAGASVAAIPVVGWSMVPGVTAATYAELAGTAGMASLEVGTFNVPADMMAQIHQGEIIVPPFESAMIRSGQATLGGGAPSGSGGPSSGGGGGDMHVHFDIHAIDTQSGAAFIQQQAPHIAMTLKRHWAATPSVRPS
jgi:hypothetical protein